jgi:hypothetical protein
MIEMKKVTKPSRREFLKVAGASSLGLLLSHLPTRWAGGVYAADAPERPRSVSALSPDRLFWSLWPMSLAYSKIRHRIIEEAPRRRSRQTMLGENQATICCWHAFSRAWDCFARGNRWSFL